MLSLLLCACGGQSERNAEIPTKEEAADYAENELGIKGASVSKVQDVSKEGGDYYEIDAIYTMTSDRGLDFELLRTYDYDTLFGGGYYYNWITDYYDVAMEDYLEDHPLPKGVSFSEGTVPRHNSGARRYLGNSVKQIWFDFTTDEEFEDYIDALEAWLDDWVTYEKQFLAKGKDPVMYVAAFKAQDDTMKSSIQIYRHFGYEDDSFSSIAEDGETYRWSSFKKAMQAGYEAKKKLMLK